MNSKPYIVCHMMMSIDGRIDCAMTAKLAGVDDYYKALDNLNTTAALSGRVTAELEMALPGKFEPKKNIPLGREEYSRKRKADRYEIIVDTKGTLLWDEDNEYEDHIIIITGENVSREYVAYLDLLGVSRISCGKDRVDLKRATEILAEKFQVKRLAVVGGSTINTAFLSAGLLDEISILIGPGIDGRKGLQAVFDGLPEDSEPIPLKLKDIKAFESGAVQIIYSVQK